MTADELISSVVALITKAVQPPPAAPDQDTPEWVSISRFAGKHDYTAKTIAGYARLAASLQRVSPSSPELVRKYGRSWRVHRVRFDSWLRSDGPRRARQLFEQEVH